MQPPSNESIDLAVATLIEMVSNIHPWIEFLYSLVGHCSANLNSFDVGRMVLLTQASAVAHGTVIRPFAF